MIDDWVRKNSKNNFDEKNFKMSENIFRACKETNVPRLIVASSVHCHNIKYLENANYTNYINIKTPTNPSSSYGKDKVKIEDLGKNYSKFYDVVCIRFGGIEKVDMCFWKTTRGKSWYSFLDCQSFMGFNFFATPVISSLLSSSDAKWSFQKG